ncbi:hypothetical protein EDD16DRAFT_1706130 [Pisolithus croceorrhizus]|nr:hypothetical protein EDD16DRAFT_1706130 [Pisolithus croceorrhizus]
MSKDLQLVSQMHHWLNDKRPGLTEQVFSQAEISTNEGPGFLVTKGSGEYGSMESNTHLMYKGNHYENPKARMQSNVAEHTTHMYALPDKLWGHNIIHTGRTQNHLQNNSTLNTEPNEVVTGEMQLVLCSQMITHSIHIHTSEPQLPTAAMSLKDMQIALTRTPHASKCMYRQNWDTSDLAPGILVPKSDTTDPIQEITSAPPVNTQDPTSEAELKPANSPVTPAAADAGSTHTEMDQTSPDLKSGT